MAAGAMAPTWEQFGELPVKHCGSGCGPSGPEPARLVTAWQPGGGGDAVPLSLLKHHKRGASTD